MELLIVIAVLGILLGILLPSISWAIRRTQVGVSRGAVMKCLEAAGRYRQDHRRYPWCRQADVEKLMREGRPDLVEIRTSEVFAELRGRGSVNRRTDYLQGLPPRLISDLGAGPTLVDAWGREIVIRVSPGDSRPVVYSVGPNGQDETADGTSPEPLKQPDSYYLFKRPGPSDDVPSR
jgi:type II secretory pathway pseudopilin PulG